MARKFSGARLRTARVAAGKKPEQVALRIDRSVFSVHEYERGRARPAADVLGALADALGCPVDTFFAGARGRRGTRRGKGSKSAPSTHDTQPTKET